MEGTSRSEQTSGASSNDMSSCRYTERSVSQVQESELSHVQVQVQHPQLGANGAQYLHQAANPFATSGPNQ